MSIIVGNLLIESNDQPLLSEEKDGEMYVGGIFAGADKINNNKRVYSEAVLDEGMEKYLEEKVRKSMGIQELGHSETPKICMDRIAAKIVDLKKDGKEWVGKSKILKDLPCGNIAYGLLKNGIKIGSSTRAIGASEPRKWTENNEEQEIQYVTQVQIRSVDLVFEPSYSPAVMSIVSESKQYILDNSNDTVYELNEETYKKFESQLKSLPKKSEDRQKVIFESIQNFLNSLRSNR